MRFFSRSGVCGILPQPRKVTGQGCDSRSLHLVDGEVVGLAQALGFLLLLVQGAKLAVPLCLQSIGDETVSGIHVHVAALRQVRFITGPAPLAGGVTDPPPPRA